MAGYAVYRADPKKGPKKALFGDLPETPKKGHFWPFLGSPGGPLRDPPRTRPGPWSGPGSGPGTPFSKICPYRPLFSGTCAQMPT